MWSQISKHSHSQIPLKPTIPTEEWLYQKYRKLLQQDGGLTVLYGNIARNGCIVKTAGVDPSIYNFTGSVKVFDSQEESCDAILGDKIKKGDIVVIRYEGPKGGPGMQEMLYPTTYLKSKGLDKDCA